MSKVILDKDLLCGGVKLSFKIIKKAKMSPFHQYFLFIYLLFSHRV